MDLHYVASLGSKGQVKFILLFCCCGLWVVSCELYAYVEGVGVVVVNSNQVSI